APYEVPLLLHGETSEMIRVVALVPGEPVSIPSAARMAPFTPTALSVVTDGSGSVVLPIPAVLSNVLPVVDTPKATPVTRFPAESNRLTASPPVLRPTPPPL